MARSTKGIDRSNLNDYLQHMQRAVVYTTSQTTGTVMRTTPNAAPRRPPATRAAPRQHRPTMYSSIALDLNYLAAHPFTP